MSDRAHQQRLADRSEWHALLHYKTRRFSRGVESHVDTQDFFLSPDGKRNPHAELDATLAAFLADRGEDSDDSAQCRFIARYQWLDRELGFDPERIPSLPCRKYQRWLREMEPDRITLVFPAAYLNNPASMFGHTLLRVDGRDQEKRTDLLAYTINYAAKTDLQRGFAYAYNGLFGGYQGKFSVAPYYLMVKEYGDMEHRDIWEFGLNLSREEIDLMLRHVWELRTARFDYYFLDENCSYHLLSLLEVARPGLRLTDRFSWWAIPSETVRAVREAGLMEDVRYRPARTTVLRERARLMDDGEQVLARKLATSELSVDDTEVKRLAPVNRARVLELALDYAAYRKSPRFGSEGPDTGTVPELLNARSRLDAPDQTPVVPMPETAPGDGHPPAHIGAGYGYEDEQHFVELTASPGYHDILDPDGGFTPGAAISALRAAVRYYPDEGNVELERLDVLEIISLSSWDRFLHPVSWKAAVGVGRKKIAPRDRLLMGRVNAGAGISHEYSDGTWLYAFAEGAVEMSDRFEWFVAPGIGPSLGVVHDFSRKWRAGLDLRWQLSFLDEWRNDYAAVLQNRFFPGKRNSLGIDLFWKREFGNSFAGLRASWEVYF